MCNTTASFIAMLPSNVDETSDAPGYSAEPAFNERILERALPFERTVPTGTYTSADEHLRLTLKEQVDSAKVPSYGRHGLIKGELLISEPEEIVSVDIKLKGHLEMALGGIGKPASIEFFKLKHSVWRPATTDTVPSASKSCPAYPSFEMKLPAVYHGRNLNEIPLPPSCEISVLDCSILCKYTLTVTASKAPRLGIKKRKRSFMVDVDYHPEMLPPRPVLPLDMSFSETESSMPSAWHEVKSTVQPRYKSGLQPIQCQFNIPSARIFGISSPIPFHIRLIGPLTSLRTLYAQNSTASTGSKSNIVRVQLMRSVHANSRGSQVRKHFPIGEGEVHALPPRSAGADGEDVLEWEGHVRCTSDATVGGFVIDDTLLIKDYVVLSVYPPTAHSSPLLGMQSMQYVLMIDDRWSLDSGRAQY
ncbi:hypothetical protein FIBSPDRAFT_796081 [Athelia psychrophila]|uniref:Arrestin-like N-terminal domain-containing protein n=1 Tax=Athelia psychrophila TaxID=1759441 RepID=A0A166DTW5_9AGAM|nr:hypothetical protein FIBSPDRAFT_796081 [Fibularhizoctonia sp. CBS 109695]